MILREELYFEITVEGRMADLRKLENFMISGAFDDFFEFTKDYVTYENDNRTDPSCRMVLTNDDYGIEITKFNPEDFLDILCPVARELAVSGHFYDIEDEEYRFVSLEGDSGYTDADDMRSFNDELDEKAREEDKYDEEEDY